MKLKKMIRLLHGVNFHLQKEKKFNTLNIKEEHKFIYEKELDRNEFTFSKVEDLIILKSIFLLQQGPMYLLQHTKASENQLLWNVNQMQVNCWVLLSIISQCKHKITAPFSMLYSGHQPTPIFFTSTAYPM